MKKQFFFAIVAVFGIFSSRCISAQVFDETLLLSLNRINSAQINFSGTHVVYEMQQMSIAENRGNNDLYLLDLKTNKLSQITATPTSEGNVIWDKNNLIWFMSTTEKQGNQIFTFDFKTYTTTQRSNFKVDFGGFVLSPNLNKIATIQAVDMNISVKEKHADMPKANVRMYDDLLYRHWNFWNEDTREHLFVYDVLDNTISPNGKDITSKNNFNILIPPMGGTEDICFSIDGKKLFFATKPFTGQTSATSTNSDIFEYDFEKLITKNLTESNKGYDKNPIISPDGKLLSWLSMKTDGNESDKQDLILYNLETGTRINLTEKQDFIVDAMVWNAKSNSLFAIIPVKGTKHIFEISIDGKKFKQLTAGQFDINSLSFGSDKLIATRTTMVDPADIVEIDLKKGILKQLTEVNKEKLNNTQRPKIEERWVETTDGKKMHVWVAFPPNFDANKTYPTLLYCQGGPQSMVSQAFSYRWNIRLMASKGYIVVAPNRRGLPGFGQAWNDAISKDWGGQAMRDYLNAIDELSNEPYVDVNRLGAVGASYGGFSTYYLAGIHNKRFKTFVSHCGLFNMESWYLTTEELFFANNEFGGAFWKDENKEIYAKNSPHKMIQNWDTPMLVIHGENDFRVPFSEGLQAFQAAKLMGLRSKLLSFPSEGHWISKPQNGMIWFREFYEWLAIDLKPELSK